MMLFTGCRMRHTAKGTTMFAFEGHFAVYEKQLFSEKMVTACFLDPEQLNKWNDNVSVQTISAANLVEICEGPGAGRVHYSH